MKFIHCADLHLDSRMEAHLSAAQARTRNQEICMTFGRLARYAAENGVRAVLLAGDLFDTERISAATAGYFLDTVASVPQVDFLYLRGNHDESERAFTGRTLPENLRLFSDRWQSVRYGEVCVSAVELTRDNWGTIYDTLSLNEGDINLVMLHGQQAARPGEGLVSLNDLRHRHIRYLALGHLHSFQCGALDNEGEWCYSGCLEGRGFDECGQKGFVLLDIDGRRLEKQFVPFASRTLWEVPVDITGLETVSELRGAMETAAADIPSRDLVKFTLTGVCGPDTQKDFDFLRRMFAERFWFVRIKDESRMQLSPEDYRYDVSLKGAFVRQVLAEDLSEEEKERIIRSGLQALRGEEIGE